MIHWSYYQVAAETVVDSVRGVIWCCVGRVTNVSAYDNMCRYICSGRGENSFGE